MIVANINRTASRLARVVGSVQCSAASTSVVASLGSQFMVDAQQQREEVRVLQEGMAHCDGL